MAESKMIVVDGQTYDDESEVWDLGSFVCVDADGNIRHYEGLSIDAPTKLPIYTRD